MNRKIMKLAAALLLAATAAAGNEWSFDGPNALQSDDGKLRLTGSAKQMKEKGVVGDALYFDGKKDFLELRLEESNRLRNEMTVSFWIKPEADSDVFQLFRSAGRDICFDGGPGFGWYEVNTAQGRQIYNGYAHPQRLRPGQWYHFALVYDQTGLGMYLDGELIGRADAENPGELRFSGQPYRIGGKLWNQAGFFHGLLDQLVVSPVAQKDFTAIRALKKQQRLAALGVESLDQYRAEKMRTLFGDAAAELPFAVAVESSLTRILPNDFYVGGFASDLTLKSAAFERENFQLLILPYQGKELKNFQVKCPEFLIGESGEKVPFSFKTSRVNYALLPKPSPYMYTLPSVPEQLMEQTEFEFTPERLAPIWVEVFTPAGTKSGVYQGNLTLTAKEGGEFALPLTVRVWDYELPQRNIVPTLINIWERDLQTYLPEGDVEGFMTLYKEYGSLLLEHRLNPVVMAHTGLVAPWVRDLIYPNCRVENGKAVANWQYFDRLVADFRAKGLSTVAIGPHYNFDATKLGGGNWEENIKATEPEKVWPMVRDHAKQGGYLADAVAYAIDEPENDVPFINFVSSTLQSAAPDLSMLLTSGGANYPDEKIENIDIWVPILHWTNRPEQLKKQQQGIPVWTYVCTGPNYPYPNLHSDTPPSGIRMLAVGSARFGYDGFLHWAANFNTYKNAPVDQPNSFAAGEGTYIYADENGHPVPTVRLKVLADGMEDWTSLKLLAECDPAGYLEVMADMEQLFPEQEYDKNQKIDLKTPKEASFATFLSQGVFYDVYDNPELWLRIRDKIGEKLSAAQTKASRQPQIEGENN